MTQAYDFNKAKENSLTKPRDKAWENWAKFEKIGDKAEGFIRDVFFRAGEGQFAEQRGLTLEQGDGVLINVGIKHIDFILKQTDGLKLNDPLTVIFEKEIPPTVKGHSPTKNFGFYGANLPENESQKTVAVLEAEDRKIAVEVAAVAEAKSEAEFNGDAPAAAVETNPETGLPFESPAPAAAAPEAAPVAPTPEAAPVAAPSAEATATPAAPTAPAAPVAPAAPKA